MRKEQNIATKIKKILQRKEYLKEKIKIKNMLLKEETMTLVTTEFYIILYQVYFLFEMEFVN